tara:strand:- start:172 stop:1152 length:981 start_codon:yes stop_codon:yes gene_type:complete
MACTTKFPNKQHLKSDRYKLRNWPEYNNALKQRGSIIVWIDPECNTDWYYSGARTPGGKVVYSDLAIEVILRIRQIYHQPLRQTQGMMEDIARLLKLDVQIPDYSVVSRRAKKLNLSIQRFTGNNVESGSNETTYMIIDSTGLKIYGEGEWSSAKHNSKPRKSWRKLHISVGKKGDVQAVILTDRHTDDSSQVPVMQDQMDQPVVKAIADGAYDTRGAYESLLKDNPNIKIVIPPRDSAVSAGDNVFDQRNKHISYIHNYGREQWEKRTEYIQQARAENTMYRYKTIIGGKLRSRHFDSQKNEAVLSCSILNKMASFGMPDSYKIA